MPELFLYEWHGVKRFMVPVSSTSTRRATAADAPLIDTHTAQESTTLEGRYLETMPLLTRNMRDFNRVPSLRAEDWSA